MLVSDLVFDHAAFARTDIQAILSAIPERDDGLDSIALRQAASQAEATGDAALGGTLRLLGIALDPTLASASSQEPFRPYPVIGGQPSPVPEDFTPDQVRAFASILDAVRDAELKARLADIVWLRRGDLSDKRAAFDAARIAVGAYLEAAEAPEAAGQIDRAIERLERAARLARLVDSKGKDMRPRAEAALVGAARRIAAAGEHGWLCRLHGVLHELHVGEPAELALLFEQAADALDREPFPEGLPDLLDCAVDWRRRANDLEGERAAILRTAEALARRAELHAQGGGHPTAVLWMERAIAALQTLPAELRGSRDGQWRQQLRAWQPRMREAIQSIRTELDISDLVTAAEAEVSGRGLLGALCTLVRLHRPQSPESIREQVLESRRRSTLTQLFFNDVTVVDRSGKTIRRVASTGDEGAEPQEAAIRFHMVQRANQLQHLAAASLIDPACRVITQEHQIDTRVMLSLVRHSRFVPAEREGLWARGLAAGFTDDFTLATHLLLPQIECSLRELLRAQGVDVAGFDKLRQQEDWNLNHILLDKSRGRQHCERLLGSTLAFDLQALLVEPTGFNLRNRVAHGLVGEGEFEAGACRYFFWQALHLCLMPLLLAIEKERAEGTGGEQAVDETVPTDQPS